MNPSFDLVLKSERCIEAQQTIIFSCKAWHQDREFESESKKRNSCHKI